MKFATAVHRYIQTFEALRGWNGVDFLTQDITLNSQTVSPTFRYNGIDAATGGWIAEVGNTLDRIAVGVEPDYDQGTQYLSTRDGSIKFKSSDYMQESSDVNYTNVGTNDYIKEVVLKTPDSAAAAGNVLNNRNADAIGYSILFFTDNNIYFILEDSGAAQKSAGTGALALSTWYHIIGFANRSGNYRMYVNGTFIGTTDISGASGTLNNAQLFTIGARSNAAQKFSGSLAHATLWQSATLCSGTTAEQDTVAQERFEKACGVYPQLAEGTSLSVVRTRSTTAYLDKLESGFRKLYRVGANHPRIVHREDKNSDEIKAYLGELASKNWVIQSEDISTTWVKVDAGDTFDLNAIAALNKSITMDGLIADATDGDHGITQAVTLTAVNWCASCFSKKGNKNFLYIEDETVANAYAYFDIDLGTVETIGAGAVNAYIEDWGDGYIRACLIVLGTVAAHTFAYKTANADTDKDFSGDALTVNTYLWGMQIEPGDYMTSYIDTLTAAVTRTADTFQYKGDDGNLGGIGSELQGTIKFDLLTPDYDQETASKDILLVNDGGAAADEIKISTMSDQSINTDIRSTAGNAGDVDGGNWTDGIINEYRLRYETDDMKVFINDVLVGSDALVDIPDNLDIIDLISSGNLIANLRFYKESTSQ